MNPLTIQFYVDGKLYGQRSWHVAPRVGDEVMLGPSKPKAAYRVVRVVWGVEGPEEDVTHRQAVNIEVERPK